MSGCPFTGGEDDKYPYAMLLNGTTGQPVLQYVCPCPVKKLLAAHGALSSQGKQLVPMNRRREPWHVEIVEKLIERKEAAAAAKRLH